MNPEDRDTPTPNGAGIDPREWEAQERALRAERLKLDAGQGDARTAQYRMIARALRQPPVSPMPAAGAVALCAAMTWGLQHLRRGDDAGGVPG